MINIIFFVSFLALASCLTIKSPVAIDKFYDLIDHINILSKDNFYNDSLLKRVINIKNIF